VRRSFAALSLARQQPDSQPLAFAIVGLAVQRRHLPLRESLSATGNVFAGRFRYSQLAGAIAAFKAKPLAGPSS
jgi:hypothetical protein